ncbi:response regulator [Litoribacillus peritrichatus]|uniref:histidine kinase n=1 Tax=Litoribacillus peritrichatus TaxID=718191 RepID=A0ABP7N8Z3_9GAMM
MKNWGIQSRILLITLLPLITISCVLGGYFIKVRLNDLDTLVEQRGLATIRQLAPACEYGLITNNTQVLQKVANSTLNELDVRAAKIYNKYQQQLVHSGPNMHNVERDSELPHEVTIYRYGDTIRLITPIFAQNLPNLQKVEATLNPTLGEELFSEKIGWAELELSLTNTELKKYQALLTSCLLLFSGVLVCAVITIRFSREITTPLIKLTHAVESIKQGNLDVRVNSESGGELRILESGVNSMASSLKTAYDEMQQSIDQATEDYRQTLEQIEIQNVELNLTRREALKASQIKSEFLANMSHEIRTPLNGIIGFTNLILKTQLTARQLDYTSTIKKSSEGLLAIINDVLDFSKIEAGKLVLDKTPMNLRDLIEEILTMMAPAGQDKSLELVSLVYSDVPSDLIGDPLRIKQIITNLVNNAIKFTNKGSVIVRTMLEEQKQNTVTLKISVTDTGIGMTDDQQQELFRAFTQADTSTTRQYGGTGLGLVISKKLVEQMSGDIGIESTLNQGSTFWFTIKVQTEDDASTIYEMNRLMKKKALIFDTHPTARLALSHAMQQWEMEVDEVDDLEILEELAFQANNNQAPFDVVVLGIGKDQLENKQIMDSIRRIQEHLNLKTIVLINTTEQQAVQRFQLLNVTCLTKPIISTKLHAALINGIFEKNTPLLPQKSEPTYNELSHPGKVSILAVDDNEANLKLIKTLLTDMGHTVYEAKNGAEAVEQVQINTPDLVFMDIQMPVMDGVEATKTIRSLDERKYLQIPIIALTAHALSGEKETLIKAGLNDYMTKPVSEDQLIATINKWANIESNNTTSNTSPGAQEERALVEKPFTPPELDETLVSVDIQECIKLAAGKEDLARDMLGMLIESFPRDIPPITEAFENDQNNDLLNTVHKVHGGTRYTGVPKLRSICHAFETAIKENNGKAQLEVFYRKLIEEVESVKLWTENNDWLD